MKYNHCVQWRLGRALNTWKTNYMIIQGCKQVAKALNVPPTAVLGGYLVLCSYIISLSTVEVPVTDWSELVLPWLTVTMPTVVANLPYFAICTAC